MARTKSTDQSELAGMESEKNEAIERAGRALRKLELEVKEQQRTIKNKKSKLRELMHDAGIKPIDVNGEDVYLYKRGNLTVSVEVRETVKVILDDEVRGQKGVKEAKEAPADESAASE